MQSSFLTKGRGSYLCHWQLGTGSLCTKSEDGGVGIEAKDIERGPRVPSKVSRRDLIAGERRYGIGIAVCKKNDSASLKNEINTIVTI